MMNQVRSQVVDMLTALAKRGDASASLALGVMYMAKPGNGEKVEQWLRAAEDRQPVARLLLARLLLSNKETAAEGLAFASSAAATGLAEAATLVGIAYDSGLGVEANRSEARSWFEKAAELGDPHAFIWLGRLHVDDRGHILNLDKVIDNCSKALEFGLVAANGLLAKAYLESGDPARRIEAFQLLDNGATTEDFGSLVLLSSIYRFGHYGEKKDPQRAKSYSDRALAAQKRASSRLGLS